MLRVETRITPSPIHGLGLFAVRAIPAGTTIWRYDEGFDLSLPLSALDGIPEIPRTQLLTYIYHSKDTGLYVLCADAARFMNHSPTPNTTCVPDERHIEQMTVAVCDIAAGEELTCNYELFDAGWDPAEIR